MPEASSREVSSEEEVLVRPTRRPARMESQERRPTGRILEVTSCRPSRLRLLTYTDTLVAAAAVFRADLVPTRLICIRFPPGLPGLQVGDPAWNVLLVGDVVATEAALQE